MKVLYVVSEAFPFAKYGGLGEVAGEYPKAMAAQNVDVRVVMPLYQGISDVYREQMEFMISYPVNLALETAFCGLYKMRNWPISALSYGQKKRVTICSILVLEPDMMILDEPTAGQDYRNYTRIMEFLKSLNDFNR